MNTHAAMCLHISPNWRAIISSSDPEMRFLCCWKFECLHVPWPSPVNDPFLPVFAHRTWAILLDSLVASTSNTGTRVPSTSDTPHARNPPLTPDAKHRGMQAPRLPLALRTRRLGGQVEEGSGRVTCFEEALFQVAFRAGQRHNHLASSFCLFFGRGSSVLRP